MDRVNRRNKDIDECTDRVNRGLAILMQEVDRGSLTK
jgi:hypothetical protein